MSASQPPLLSAGMLVSVRQSDAQSGTQSDISHKDQTHQTHQTQRSATSDKHAQPRGVNKIRYNLTPFHHSLLHLSVTLYDGAFKYYGIYRDT